MKKIDIKTKKNLVFPTFLFSPTNKSKIGVIYLGGCGAAKNISQLFGINESKLKYHFFCFDYRGCGDSKLKPSRLNRRYVKDLFFFIEEIKNSFKEIKKIYLVAESWGGNLAMIFQNKYRNVVSGYVLWNVPTKVVNNTKKVEIKKYDDTFSSITAKTMLTLFTNINTKLRPPGVEELSSNEVYAKCIRVGRANGGYTNARMVIAAWTSMRPSWNYIKKHFKSGLVPPIYIIQSKKDLYYKKNIKIISSLEKFTTKNNKIFTIENGGHVLSVETKHSSIIWNSIEKIISI